MWIQHPEQRIGNLRELLVDLEMDPRGEECESLDQALNVRIFAFVGFKKEPARHLGIGRS